MHVIGAEKQAVRRQIRSSQQHGQMHQEAAADLYL